MAAASNYTFVFPDPDGESGGDYYHQRCARRRQALEIKTPLEEAATTEQSACFPPLAEGMAPFPDCQNYEKHGGCNIVLHQHYEGSRGDILKCKTCGRTFSSRRCGVFFKSRLSQAQVEAVNDHYRRGDSIRQTARQLGLNRGTVRRYYRLLDEMG